jgi:hypothetical protein
MFLGLYQQQPSLSKWFYDTSTGTAARAARCGSLLEGLSLLSSRLWRKHGGHEDLYGLGRRSVTPYVRIVVLLCILQASVELA